LAAEPSVTQDEPTHAQPEPEPELETHAQPEPEPELEEPARLSTKLDAYVNALDKVELLSTLTPAEKLRLAQSLSTEEFGAGESIVEAGQAADCMYLLESGSADAVKPSSSPPVAEKGEAAFDILKTYSRGDFFGELALQSGGVRQATVKATSFETTVLKLPRSAFQTIVATNSGAAAKLQEERARYAEASSRLLAAARQQKPAAEKEADQERRQQARELRQKSARTVQRVFRGWRARGRVAKIQVSGHSALCCSTTVFLGQDSLPLI
jgi:CRP-like cAMP-binding protein